MAERAAAAMAERVAVAERSAPQTSGVNDKLPPPAAEKPPAASWSAGGAAAAQAAPPPSSVPGTGVSAREHEEMERLRTALSAAQREVAELRAKLRAQELLAERNGEEMRTYREALERRDEEHRQARLDEEAKRQVAAPPRLCFPVATALGMCRRRCRAPARGALAGRGPASSAGPSSCVTLSCVAGECACALRCTRIRARAAAAGGLQAALRAGARQADGGAGEGRGPWQQAAGAQPAPLPSVVNRMDLPGLACEFGVPPQAIVPAIKALAA